MTIGERIAKCRKEKNLSQEYIAEILDVSRQAVSKWESAQNCPDIQLLPEISVLFGVTIDEPAAYLSTQIDYYVKDGRVWEGANYDAQ